MKYSFFSSACAWFPSALMMAVSASGASSAPFASLVKYVPVHTVPQVTDTSTHRHWHLAYIGMLAFFTLSPCLLCGFFAAAVAGPCWEREVPTFMPGQVAAQDDDEAECDEDHHCHNAADQCVVRAVLGESVGVCGGVGEGKGGKRRRRKRWRDEMDEQLARLPETVMILKHRVMQLRPAQVSGSADVWMLALRNKKLKKKHWEKSDTSVFQFSIP